MDKVPIYKLGGLRVNWDSVSRTSEEPLITIITSTFNAGKDLHWTGDAIRSQTYPFVQWIIADGSSQDDTLSVVKQYDDIIDIWFSEPDEGIYDAWNKALRHAKGDWIQFLGAGDELAESTTLEQIAPVLAKAYPRHDLVYGNLLFISQTERQALKCVGQPWEEMTGKWSVFRPQLPPHPSIFHCRKLLTSEKSFDTRFKIAADSYLLMKSIKKKKPFYCDMLIDRMPIGGVSSSFTAVLKFFRETRRASLELGYHPPLQHQVFEFFLLVVKFLFSKLLPRKISYALADGFRLICGENVKWSRK